MNNLLKLTDPLGKKGSNSLLIFLLGGAITAIGTYVFFTEKGAATRRKIARQISHIPEGNPVSRNTFSRSSGRGRISHCAGLVHEGVGTNAEAGPVSKAQNMVSHLKHK